MNIIRLITTFMMVGFAVAQMDALSEEAQKDG